MEEDKRNAFVNGKRGKNEICSDSWYPRAGLHIFLGGQMESQDMHSVEIAIIKEQLSGLREQQKAHMETTGKLFDRVFERLDTVFETLNKGKGVYAASLVLAGIIGGAVVKGVATVITWGK